MPKFFIPTLKILVLLLTAGCTENNYMLYDKLDTESETENEIGSEIWIETEPETETKNDDVTDGTENNLDTESGTEKTDIETENFDTETETETGVYDDIDCMQNRFAVDTGNRKTILFLMENVRVYPLEMRSAREDTLMLSNFVAGDVDFETGTAFKLTVYDPKYCESVDSVMYDPCHCMDAISW